MDRLREAQAGVFSALQTGAPCFLRICLTDDALWVSDLPRRLQDVSAVKEALLGLGVGCREANGLWKLDWLPERYAALAEALPKAVPPLPWDGALHEAYALCRLLLIHPAPVPQQPVEPVRAVLKLPQKPAGEQLQAIRALAGQCAAGLRMHRPLPTMAGGLLAERLSDTR